MSERKEPRIRFKGFEDDWEQRKLSDLVGTTYGGGTPTTSNEEFWNGDIPWIQSSNLIENQLFDVNVKRYISQDGLYHSAAQLVPKDSVAVVTHVGVGKLVYMPYSYTSSQDFISLSDMKCEPRFLCYALYRKLREDLHIVQGSAIKGITKEDLMSKELMLPEVGEQKEIADTMFDLDCLITLHQRKLENLKNIKKSMLENLFPQKGEKVPKLRFKGFSDDWEQRKLSEIAEIIGGGTPSTNNPSYWNGNIDWYAPTEIGSQIYTKGSARKITEEGLKNSSAKILPAYKTVLFTSRAGIGNMAILQHLGATNQGFQSLVCHDGIEPYFIYSMGHIIKVQAERVAAGSTFSEISGKKLGMLSFMFPDFEEQHRIGTFFKNLDCYITLHQRKLDKLRNIKKAMLESMFI